MVLVYLMVFVIFGGFISGFWCKRLIDVIMVVVVVLVMEEVWVMIICVLSVGFG